MTNQDLEKLKYPIGHFECPENISEEIIKNWISVLEVFPNRLEKLVSGLSDDQLDTVYRPNGWTIRQVVHHISDSHHHSYTRFKWALTEDKPVIKTYFEELWAELIDSKSAPIEMSLQHIKAIHFKLVYLLKTLTEVDLNKSFIHPETNSEVKLNYQIGNYAWHSDHHYAHIENVLK
ncbi:putative metal-dependent hydrolase [Tamlana sp. 2_MG-2023]|uniref:YfiT family bacillithiol transferase n=1 Tax=unclassified Tamlana TaxID=2614803 RepID=UPI0026E3AB2C|nr:MULTISPECIES: putative metal-dependent hydrolase [unclassified Tamlana]MDO6758786.1 putative metal-dependent hydrolase [Tamlana sp. 2_MG-2023]MDO6789485.1 putative metal-dependent hydrolase [Tamlana sp. 1_MG-2023]